MVSWPKLNVVVGLTKVATMVSLATQFFCVTSSQYVPLVVTLRDEVVAFVFHKKVAFVDVSLSRSAEPTQSVVSLPKFTTGVAFCVSTMVSASIPHIFESCPQYKPAADTEIELVMAPVLHL